MQPIMKGMNLSMAMTVEGKSSILSINLHSSRSCTFSLGSRFIQNAGISRIKLRPRGLLERPGGLPGEASVAFHTAFIGFRRHPYESVCHPCASVRPPAGWRRPERWRPPEGVRRPLFGGLRGVSARVFVLERFSTFLERKKRQIKNKKRKQKEVQKEQKVDKWLWICRFHIERHFFMFQCLMFLLFEKHYTFSLKCEANQSHNRRKY